MAEKDVNKQVKGSATDEARAVPDQHAARTIPVGADGQPAEAALSPEHQASAAKAEEVDPVQVLQAKVAELEDQRLRALAELDNSRKRMARQIDELVRFANDRLFLELLDVVDNFERALRHANENGAVGESGLEALRSGTELIYNQLNGLLSRYDVKPLESIGRRFDPKYHDALVHAESDEYGEGIVSAEISKGYTVGDRVLRHARVVVSKGKAPESEPDRPAE
ncbi:MAG: nucleotide exchange factor GrpE [Candidatus Zixiibacteriota bacterium]